MLCLVRLLYIACYIAVFVFALYWNVCNCICMCVYLGMEEWPWPNSRVYTNKLNQLLIIIVMIVRFFTPLSFVTLMFSI